MKLGYRYEVHPLVHAFDHVTTVVIDWILPDKASGFLQGSEDVGGQGRELWASSIWTPVKPLTWSPPNSLLSKLER